MPEYYAPPNSSDTLGFFELARYTNTATDGLMFPVILMVIFVVVFVATKQFSTAKAFTFASFVCVVASLPLALLDVMSPRFMYLFGILLATGAVWLKLDGGGKSF